jgi:hypothetical protein
MFFFVGKKSINYLLCSFLIYYVFKCVDIQLTKLNNSWLNLFANGWRVKTRVSNASAWKVKATRSSRKWRKDDKMNGIILKTKYKYSLCLMYDIFGTNYLRIFFLICLKNDLFNEISRIYKLKKCIFHISYLEKTV